MLIKSDSLGVGILEIIKHPKTRINTRSKGFFCFRNSAILSERVYFPEQILKNRDKDFLNTGELVLVSPFLEIRGTDKT
jgi:hypothetical protein